MSPHPDARDGQPLCIRLSLRLIRAASLLVPLGRRATWRAQWTAELMHRWQRREALALDGGWSKRGIVLWSCGSFPHAWYLFRTEYTMDIIWHDVRYGLRTLWRSKGLIAIAVLSLAIGIGANASVFSAVDVFMLRPLPYPDSHELQVVWITNQERGWTQTSFTVPDFLDLRDESRTMRLAATRGGTFNLSGDFDAERLTGHYVTPGFFQVLEVQPAIGRAFTPDEARPGNDRVAIISDGVWRRRFGADPDVVGSSIILDGAPHTLVGVMPPHFWYRYPGPDVWAPLAFTGEETRSSHNLRVLARRNDEVTPEQAQQEAQRLIGQFALAYPESSAGNSARMETLHEDVFNEGFQAGTMISTVGVTLLLLIACANVANLLLTHAAGRDREVALRIALGAGRSRIIRQFLTEATMVAVLGGLLGVGLSVLGIHGLISIMPPDFPRVHEIGLDSRVLLYTAVLTMLTGIIFGLAPALQSSRLNMTDTLKEGGRGGSGTGGARLRKSLVVGEVALALVLLVSSALLVKGFARIRLADMGFDRSDVLTMQVLLPEEQYPDSTVVHDFHTRLLGRLAALPGVEAVGGTDALPLQGNSMTYYVLEGEDFDDMAQRKLTSFGYLLPSYFDAMDIPILRGRSIEESDRAGATRVAVINQALAERHWPESNPIGERIVIGSGSREIVGVVANTRAGGYAGDRVMVFFAAHQSSLQFMDFAIEASVPLATLVEPVRAQVRALDPTIPAYDVMPLDALIVRSMGGDLIMAKIMSAIAIIALILALGGVYGVMAHSVSQRTQELGIRMSLGAQRRDVMSMVVRQGTILALIGIVIGTGIALGVTRGLARFLFGVSPFDPMTFSGVAVVLFLAGLTATFFPARRATKVDPVVALRAE